MLRTLSQDRICRIFLFLSGAYGLFQTRKGRSRNTRNQARLQVNDGSFSYQSPNYPDKQKEAKENLLLVDGAGI